MNVLSYEDKEQYLECILLQLQLAAAKQTDDDFKQSGNKELNVATQMCKQLLHLTQWESVDDNDASQCLGLSNV